MRLVSLAAGLAAAVGILGSAHAQTAGPPPLEAYGRLPNVEAISLSPIGDRFAYIGVFGEQRSLTAMTTNGKVLFVAKVSDLKVRAMEWASQDLLVIFMSQTVDLGYDWGQAHEIESALVVDLAANKVHPVFEHQVLTRPVVFGAYGYRQLNGRWYGYFGNITLEDRQHLVTMTHGWTDLYRVDLISDQVELVTRGDERSADWAVDASGAVIARSNYVQENGQWSLRMGGRTVLSRDAPLETMSLMGLGRSDDRVLVSDSSSPETPTELFEVARTADAKPEPLWADFDWGRLVRTKGGLLLGALSDNGAEAQFFDSKLKARYLGARKAFPGYQAALFSHTDDLGRQIFFTDGADDAGTYWLVDIATGSAKVLIVDRPSIKAEQVGPTQLYAYKAADGQALDGVLTLPPGGASKSLPVVVMPHGGPIGVHDKVGFDWRAQAFASRGYAVFQPNYRGSSGHGSAFEVKGYGEWGRKMLSDIADGLAALAKDGVVDPKRACIVGGSYGGYAALAGVTLQQGLYRCAAAVAGVSDPEMMLDRDIERAGYRSSTTRFMHAALGVGQAGAPKLRDISPVRFAARADAPILLVHGKDDTVVEIDQSRKMERALKAANKPIELVELAGEDHWLSRSETRLAMLKAVVAFVQKYNPAE